MKFVVEAHGLRQPGVQKILDRIVLCAAPVPAEPGTDAPGIGVDNQYRPAAGVEQDGIGRLGTDAMDRQQLRAELLGIALLQALAVGKGVYYVFEDTQIEDGGTSATAHMVVNVDYSAHQFESLPLDTRVFLVGEPLGTVQVVTVGILPAQPLQVLESIVLEWRLTWYPAVDVYPEGWTVDSIRPLAERTRFVSWEPEL